MSCTRQSPLNLKRPIVQEKTGKERIFVLLFDGSKFFFQLKKKKSQKDVFSLEEEEQEYFTFY